MKVSDKVKDKKTGKEMIIKRIKGVIATCSLSAEDCFPLFPNNKRSPIIDIAIYHTDNLELVS